MKRILRPQDVNCSAEYHNGHEPANWEDVTEFDEEGYGFVYVNGLGGFINRKGEVVIPLIYDHYAIFSNGLSVIRLNGKWGIINRSNKTVIPFEYDHCQYPVSGKIIACKNGKYGIVNLENEVLLPFEYDFISNFNEKYICVCKAGKYGVISWKQETVLKFEWEYTEIVGDYFCAGKTSDLFYNRDEFIDDALHCSENYKCFTKDYQKIDFGIIDINKNTVFPFISDFKIWNFNPENGRAEISQNWRADHIAEEDRHFVADQTGRKIPFNYFLPDDSDSEEIRKRINLLVWEIDKDALHVDSEPRDPLIR